MEQAVLHLCCVQMYKKTTIQAETPTFWDVLQGKQPHPGVPIHSPFLSLTVWLAAMIHEASQVPFGPGINDPVLWLTTYTLVCTKYVTHIMHHHSVSVIIVCFTVSDRVCVLGFQNHLVQREHVKVTDVVLLGVFDPGSTFFFIDHLSDIFAHKGPLQRKE